MSKAAEGPALEEGRWCQIREGDGMEGQMYGNNMHMSADVRMRAAASGRYRLGNPSASSMRPNMNPHPMGVPPGQSSPMGGNPMGPMGPGGQMPMMPNQGMRPQQVRKVKNALSLLY